MFSEFKEEYDKARGLEEPERESGSERLDAGEEEVEYVYLDEGGNEIEFVDEDGNVITDPSLIDEKFEEDVVIEAGAPGRGAASGKKGGQPRGLPPRRSALI